MSRNNYLKFGNDPDHVQVQSQEGAKFAAWWRSALSECSSSFYKQCVIIKVYLIAGMNTFMKHVAGAA